MSSLMKPQNADSLKLEIWREIVRARGESSYNNMSISGGGAGNYRPPPDPVASATKAVETFNALYPDPPKQAAKNSNMEKP